jgi:hypothetical protein
MHDLFSPTFAALYDTYREQDRIDSVERIQLESTDGAIPQEFLHGYPLVFANQVFPKKTELDLISLLESHCPELRIQVRRPSFDTPNQYLSEREIEEITMADYLRTLRSTINDQRSTINDQQSTINNQQSTINNQQSAISNQQSSTRAIRSYLHRWSIC